MGEMLGPLLSAFNFEWIFFILADKKDNYQTWMSLNFVKIPWPIMELAALEHLKNLLIML